MQFSRLLFIATFTLVTACVFAQEPTSLEVGFDHPPVSAMPLTWWHWINGNVSREGILADMQDMKRVGLAGAQMIDVSMYIPQGTARYGSEEWYGDVQYAIRTAHALGLSFGMMNGPGWSGSGGPWVTPDMAMQHVVWTETTIGGGHRVQIQLGRPSAPFGFYRDIAILAVPADATSDGMQPVIETIPADIFSPAEGDHAAQAVSSATVTFRYAHAVQRRTLELKSQQADASGIFAGEIQCSLDGESFHTVRRFALQGQLANASLLITFSPTTAKVFSVHLDANREAIPALASMNLSNDDRIENYRSKSVAAVVGPVLNSSELSVQDPDAIPLEEVIPLTADMAEDGSLSWDAPPGRWTILRFGYTPTGSRNHPAQTQGTGLEIDKMNQAATDFYFERSLGRILRDAGPLVGTTFNNVLLDSWESGQQNWTADLPHAFHALRKYALEKYLPTLAGRVIVSPAVSETFLRDYRRTISELVAQNYYGEFRRLAEAHHLSLYAETYDGIAFNQAESAAQSSVQMAEFWAPHMPIDDKRVKSMVSEAHVLGNTIIAAEAFTGQPEEAKWLWTPQTLKPIGDMAFAHGINRFVLHSYVHQPRSDIMPGFTLSRFGTHFGRLNTWWPMAKPWLDYTARSSFLLQQGSPVADILALRSDEMDTLQHEPIPELPPGYSCDWILPASLLSSTAGKDGIKLPYGNTYRALVLPSIWTADIKLLERIHQLVVIGIPVFGPKPAAPSSMKDLEQRQVWQELVDTLWPARRSSTRDEPFGAVLPLADTTKTLASLVTPDVVIAAQNPVASLTPVLWTHRRTGKGDIYFLANTGDTSLAITAAFHSGDRLPELWDAVTGTHADATLFKRTADGVSLPLQMQPGKSIFLIFRRPLPKRWIQDVTDTDSRPSSTQVDLQSLHFTGSGDYLLHLSDGTAQLRHLDLPTPLDLNDGWTVHFRPPLGKPFIRNFTSLHDLERDTDAEIRYFSGMALYRRNVVFTSQQLEGNGCLLELGDVKDVVDVRINGQDLGVLWTAPFSADVGTWLHEGENALEIEVTNRWVNRLIGDEHLPPDAHYALDGGPIYSGRLAEFPAWYDDPIKTASRQRTTFATWQLFSPNTPLIPSGLIGPVRIVFYRYLSP